MLLLTDNWPALLETCAPTGRWQRRPRAGGALDIRASRAAGSRPLAWRGLIRFPADRIHKAVVEALVPGALELGTPDEEWSRSHAFTSRSRRDEVSGRIGFREEVPEPRQRLLEQNGALLIKAHYALWARAFAETEGKPGAPVSVTLSQLCDDLGYARLQNGAHRPDTKRQALQILETLAALELDARYHAPDGRRVRLEGSLWRLHSHCEETRSVQYGPGEWFLEPVWRKHNHSVGLAGAGLLQLRPDRDRWAICLSAYLAALSRMNGYRPLTLRAQTLLEKSGLLHAERRNPARMREMLERALERAETAGLLSQWDWLSEPAPEPDMDSPLDLAALLHAGADWQDGRLMFHWPEEFQARAQRLRPPTPARRKLPKETARPRL